ncbi:MULTISPECIES: Npun_F5749 family FMN-dependent PPOX-type flavoprotein [Cyanophyceae]|uniref:Npun_F5749 family FMN-dependent PPOX-type flavoprotein n=1 Tax=Cyanophyceae TaxID=3028117 RepID=UPI0016842B8A|nr:Npun_F5749 family FMN-dependent PPOX-type flavoprotein [Trichocoleus sp. FACHB-832]MBD1905736.1 pyridoxamine 5'-phosphate oxidase family protein [Trichocoleus sp. FACHB-832]
MSLAPWRSPLAGALHRNDSQPHCRYLQLATVRADGRPANRTVVFRGFLPDTNQLKFVIDSRSQKPEQIDHQPWGEACWYFTNTREQFRLAGTLTLVQQEHPNPALQQARQTTWKDLSDAARVQFAWPAPRETRADAVTFSPPPPDSAQPLANFCLLLLEPVQVDHLELRGEPQNRWLYSLDSQTWTTQAVNP